MTFFGLCSASPVLTANVHTVEVEWLESRKGAWGSRSSKCFLCIQSDKVGLQYPTVVDFIKHQFWIACQRKLEKTCCLSGSMSFHVCFINWYFFGYGVRTCQPALRAAGLVNLRGMIQAHGHLLPSMRQGPSVLHQRFRRYLAAVELSKRFVAGCLVQIDL